MLISLNWLRDFVDIPADLDPCDLAERFTLTCAEVDDVRQIHKGERTPAETTCSQDDWIIEVDNKSITHRPDLWGHYGIAREFAAMLNLPLKILEVADGDRLDNSSLPEIPIVIDDPRACPRYSGVLLEGLDAQSSPDWMQSRLSHVGMRPINALVDLTNYVMAELGQPLHAFDGDKVKQIEVAVSEGGEQFVTLDGSKRTLPPGAVMIQSDRVNVALAGVMGGLDTEVTAATKSVLLESANFDAAAIRRCATALGHRTEASARFEKSIDPANTVLAIGRFVYLAEKQFSDLKLTSRVSDCFPDPPAPLTVSIDPGYVSDMIGKGVSLGRMKEILEAIEFKLEDHEDRIVVHVPSFRATKDIECEADIIEEISRFVGYDNIEPVLPRATVRYFEPNAIHRLERRTLNVLCLSEGYHEIHDYLWYHENWLKRLGYDPGESVSLKNPSASGLERIRKSVVPALLQSAELNRRSFPTLKLLNIGTVINSGGGSSAREQGKEIEVEDIQHRSLGLLSMARGKGAEDGLFEDVRDSLNKWAVELFDQDVVFAAADADEAGLPWENLEKAASLHLFDSCVGRVATVPLELRKRIDDHFAAWSVVVAEVNLTPLAGCAPPVRRLSAIPEYQVVEVDYSVLIDGDRTYESLRQGFESFDHALLRRLSFEGSYQGKSLPAGKRSLLFRAEIGHANRTMSEEDIQSFRTAFEKLLAEHDLEIRA